jgi:fibronectin-binding autotransporter adhesin
MIPVYHTLKTAWEKNFRSTKSARECAEGGEELEPIQLHTPDYNRNYRVTDGRRHRIRKFLLRIFAPVTPLHNGLKIISRKSLRAIKRAGDFGEACWHYGKKGLFRACAPLAPLYNWLKTTSRKNLLSTTRVSQRGHDEQELKPIQLDTLDYNINCGWRGGPLLPKNNEWKARAAVLASIVFGVAFIAKASMGRELLLFADATARTVVNSSVGLLSDVADFTFSKGGAGPSTPGATGTYHDTTLSTGHADSSTVGSNSGGSRINPDLLDLKGSHHTFDTGRTFLNNATASNNTTSTGNNAGSGTKSGAADAGHTSASGGGGFGGGRTSLTKTDTGAGTKTVSGTKKPHSGGTIDSGKVSTAASTPVDAQIVWSNPTNGAGHWNTGSNWVGGTVPGVGDVAAFTSGFGSPGTIQPNLNTATSISGIYFNGTGTSGWDITRTNIGVTFTLTAFGTTIDTEVSDSTAVAIGAENTSGTNTIEVPIALAPSSGNTSTISQATGGTLVINSVISGTGINLTKTGGGTLTLSGASANTYTGLTTVSAGELDLSKTAGVNAIGGNATVSGGSLIWLNNEQMGDSANLTLNSGTVNLNGNTETLGSFTNSGGTFTTGIGGHLIGTGASITWSGGTNTINDGGSVEDGHVSITGGTNTVQGGFMGGGVLRILSGGAGLEMTGSTLNLNSDNTTGGTLLLDGNVTTFASAATATIASGLFNTNPGTINLDGGTRTFTVADGTAATDMSISAVIINGGLTKAGAGLLDLSGANTYSSGTTVSDGTLRVSSSGTFGDTSGSLTVNGGVVDLNGTNQGVGALNGSGGTIVNNASSSTSTLTVGNGDGSGSYAGVLANNNNAGTGILAFTKTGAGTQTLTGTNTYTGTTQVDGGALFINGSTSSSSAVTVNNSGTTLGGSGTIGGTVNVASSGANLAPGATGNGSTAILNTGSLTLASGSNFSIDLHGAVAGTSYDQVNVTGTISITGANLVINSVSGLTVGEHLFIAENDGTDAITGTFNGLANGATFTSGGVTFQIFYDANGQGGGNDIELSVVPEPSTWLAGALALAFVVYTQRRRFAQMLRRA